MSFDKLKYLESRWHRRVPFPSLFSNTHSTLSFSWRRTATFLSPNSLKKHWKSVDRRETASLDRQRSYLTEIFDDHDLTGTDLREMIVEEMEIGQRVLRDHRLRTEAIRSSESQHEHLHLEWKSRCESSPWRFH